MNPNYDYIYDVKEYSESFQSWTLEEYRIYEELLNNFIPGKNKTTGSKFYNRVFHIYKTFQDLDKLIYSKEGIYIIGEGIYVDINNVAYETAESYKKRMSYKSNIRSWIKPEDKLKDETVFQYCIKVLEDRLVEIFSNFKTNIGFPSMLDYDCEYVSKFIIPSAKEKLEKVMNNDNSIYSRPGEIILDDMLFARTLRHLNNRCMQVPMYGKYILTNADGIYTAPNKLVNVFYTSKVQLLRFINSIQRMENEIYKFIEKTKNERNFSKTKEYKNEIFNIESLLVVLESIIVQLAMLYCVCKSDLNYYKLTWTQPANL